MILSRYIVREITAPLLSICTVLILVFSGYSAVRFLNDAVNGLLSGDTVLTLVGLKVIIALEVLIPVTLYLAVVLALSRLHTDQEVTAMEAGGISQGRMIKPVLFTAILLALLVTGLSLFARPYAYQRLYDLETVGQKEFDMDKVEPGRFYELGSNVVFFAEELYPGRNLAGNVWIWVIRSDKREVTTARSASQVNGEDGQKTIVLRDGYHSVLNLKTGGDRVIRFDENSFQIESVRNGSGEYRRKAASTAHLSASSAAKDIAELQWRYSTGPSTVLLALLAIPLSRVAPRRSKYGKVSAAIMLFFVFYNMNLIAKTLVEKKVVGAMPGIWWVDALLAALLIILLPVPNPLLRIFGRRSRAEGDGKG